MKSFLTVRFDAETCRREVGEFGSLLQANPSLPELKVLKPFFENRHQLSAFIGTYIPAIGAGVDRLAFQWDIHGDFAADIVVGNEQTRTYCMIELEEGSPDGILVAAGAKSTKEWSRKFDHGFSQLIDWFYALDDLSRTHDFQDDFGTGHIKFHGVLIAGRSAGLSESDRRRLRWREDKVLINSHSIHCLTYDELFEEFNQRLRMYSAAAARD